MAQLESGKTYIIPKTGIKDYISENGSNHTLEEYFIWFVNKIKTGLNLDLNYHIISDENIKHCFLDLPYINEPTENKLQLYLQIPSSGITSQVIPRISFVNNEDYYINKIRPDCLPQIMCYGQRSAYYINYWTTDEYDQKEYLSYNDRGAFVIDTNFLDSHGFYTIYFIVMSSSISEISEVYFTPRVFICDMIDVLEDKHSDAAFILPNNLGKSSLEGWVFDSSRQGGVAYLGSESIPAIGVERDGKYSLQGYYPQIFISDYPFYGEINYPISNSMIRVQFGRLKAANNIYLTLGNTTENLIKYCDRSLVTENHISWNENVLKINNKKYSLSCSCLKTDFDTSSCQWAVVIEDKTQEEPDTGHYLEFASDGNFYVQLQYDDIGWNGIIEYSLDKKKWIVWNGERIQGNSNKSIYFRGTNNTVISGINGRGWQSTAKYVKGNIETLLDYKTVQKKKHPKMDSHCFYEFFNLFNLEEAPELPATKLAPWCYAAMFEQTYIRVAPKLPATELAEGCYAGMFYECKYLGTAPELPATKLAKDCYSSMFNRCYNLMRPPKLPATELAEGCYLMMFIHCIRLNTLPKLPALNLVESCYSLMFSGCTSIHISYTKDDYYQYEYRIPYGEEKGNGHRENYEDMFEDTGSSIKRVYLNYTYYTTNPPI